MRVAVLSDTRKTTRAVGSHGLGRVAWDIAAGLSAREDEVTLFAGIGSCAPDGVTLICDSDEDERAYILKEAYAGDFDALIDLSHSHTLSQIAPDAPVVNYVCDMECAYQPPNCLVVNEYMQARFPAAKIVRVCIDVDNYPFVAQPDNYALFAAKVHIEKGWDIALTAARIVGVRLIMIGENMSGLSALPDDVEYAGEVSGSAIFNRYLSRARVLLSPSRNTPGGRVVLEASACGTPSITLDADGLHRDVTHGVNGIVAADTVGVINALHEIGKIDRAGCRAYVKAEHDMPRMIDGIERALQDAAHGARW